MNCPECGSADVRISRHAHAMDVVQRLLGRRAFRCRECRLRFYALKSEASKLEASRRWSRFHRRPTWRENHEGQSHLRRTLGLLAIFVLAFIIFLIFLRYLATERNPSDEAPASLLPVCHFVLPA